MEAKDQKFSYMEWKSPEEMHISCLQWLSEIHFIEDEHIFLEDMLREYTLPVLEAHFYEKARNLITELSTLDKRRADLKTRLLRHRNRLEIMVDGKDQLEEETEYKDEHRRLKNEMGHFNQKYRNLKQEIFLTVSKALKDQKQKRLLSD
ncbi:hypothetical protein FHG64_00650 [Antarcticibacterium flavum]|uniref:Uncharacterized protein n=1 Tax=Antarcticibacterium flavum TaxID=2058175 RepID=A0A5B7X097_9FLAO|nr:MULTISPECIES: hypothetical protein [Antarcticibacterium]MCM4160856.1 hypothetical protein [Antarcticibacterium sp. W02-3]QCY68023.1 hypothetical protein FHG64_00650 [Antarcticibacterium flavum]